MPLIEEGQLTLECSDCKEELPIERFRIEHKEAYPDCSYRSKRCDPCRRAWRMGAADRKALNLARGTTRVVNPRATFYARGRVYGLTPDALDQLVVDSCGLCAVCLNQFARIREPQIDHCHATNVVRELLCQKCNLLVGAIENSPKDLRAAVRYIKKHRAAEKGVSSTT